MSNFNTLIIVFLSVCLITSNISSKSISICQHKVTNKHVPQDYVSHEHCNQKKEKKLVSFCFECECNIYQIQLIELIQSFEIDLGNKNVILKTNNTRSFKTNNLDPPPKIFL